MTFCGNEHRQDTPRNSNGDCVICNRVRAKKWREMNTMRSRDNAKRWTKENPLAAFAIQLRKYRITPAQYEGMSRSQAGLCAICKRKPNGMLPSKTRLSVDHNHVTGKVRGLLCGNCNVGLGFLRGHLGAALTYLKENGDVF